MTEKKGIHWTIQLILVVAFVFILRTFIFGTITVKGSSMEPNFHHGDFVIVNKLAYHIGEPKKGDITICWLNSGNRRENIIKRVIGVLGDEIDMQIREQGWDWEYILYINGEEQKEEYIAEAMQQAGTIDYPFIVEENCYFVMGDNRNASTDSREATVGAISKENIKGKVIFRLYPFDNIGAIKQTKER